jgi:hypothetical protein
MTEQNETCPNCFGSQSSGLPPQADRNDHRCLLHGQAYDRQTGMRPLRVSDHRTDKNPEPQCVSMRIEYAHE